MRNIYLIILLVLVSCATPSKKNNTTPSSPLKIGALKSPEGHGQKTLGQIRGTLKNKQGKLLDKSSGNLGSCKECVRGFKVGDYLTLRVVGAQKNNLKVLRQTSKDLKILHCPQGQNFNVGFSCSFRVEGKEFNLEMVL